MLLEEEEEVEEGFRDTTQVRALEPGEDAGDANQLKGAVVLEVWYDDGRVEVCGGGKMVGLGEEEEKEGGGQGEEEEREQVSARVVVVWRREWAVWRRTGRGGSTSSKYQ